MLLNINVTATRVANSCRKFDFQTSLFRGNFNVAQKLFFFINLSNLSKNSLYTVYIYIQITTIHITN